MFPVKFPAILCNDNITELQTWPSQCVDLVITSPPYDNMRNYHGYTCDISILSLELYRIMNPGGIIVWIMADTTLEGNESGTSFAHVEKFKSVGFSLLDTMIWDKGGTGGARGSKYCYTQAFEYMFIFVKGTIPRVYHLIKDRKNVAPGVSNYGTHRNVHGITEGRKKVIIQEYGKRTNIWRCVSGGLGVSTSDPIALQHPAIFPESLVKDHIISWSNPNDIVLDPFVGSGTTVKMAYHMQRRGIGIDISAEYCAIAKQRLKQQILKI